MKTEKTFLLISSVGLILFGLNIFFEFIPFENKKTNPLIIIILSLLNFIFIIRKMQKEKYLK